MFDVNHIIKLIEQRGYSCSSVEKSLKFGNGAIRRWTQSSPSVIKLYELSNFLNISIVELLNENSLKSEVENEQKLLHRFCSLDELEKEVILGKISEMILKKETEKEAEMEISNDISPYTDIYSEAVMKSKK